jgi:hypothetical protein
MSSRPVRLYKYQPVNARTLENLKMRKLWFSAPSAFNDPFDCSVDWVLKDADDDDVQRAWAYARSQADLTPGLEAKLATDGNPNDAFRRLLNRSAAQVLTQPQLVARIKQTGVACFSAKNDDLLMWAHYADGHRGFCMEFDASGEPFSKALPVVYRDAMPPPVNVLDVLDGKHTGSDIHEVMFRTKYECWQYEEEWRVLHAKAGTERTYSHDLLTGVYFGLAMPSGQKDMIGQLLHDSEVQLYEMNRGEGGFSVVATGVEYEPYHRRGSDGAH